MLSDEAIAAVTRHEAVHEIGYCSCPCLEALVGFAKAVQAGSIIVIPVEVVGGPNAQANSRTGDPGRVEGGA